MPSSADRSTPNLRAPAGSIEVITGSMFSGKTEELIRRVKRALFARQRVQAFKPRIDDRYDKTRIVSHAAAEEGAAKTLEAVAVASGVTLRFGSSSAGPPNVMLELPCGVPLVSWRGATEAVAMGSVS